MLSRPERPARALRAPRGVVPELRQLTSSCIVQLRVNLLHRRSLAACRRFMGPNYSISTACATANYCFNAAAMHLRKGDADLIIAGGIEAPIIEVGLGGFVACRALSQRNEDPAKASRPWDKGRDGFVMGEGAGLLVMETMEHAMNRGAPIIAEYLGGAITCDAHHLTDPREDGAGGRRAFSPHS